MHAPRLYMYVCVCVCLLQLRCLDCDRLSCLSEWPRSVIVDNVANSAAGIVVVQPGPAWPASGISHALVGSVGGCRRRLEQQSCDARDGSARPACPVLARLLGHCSPYKIRLHLQCSRKLLVMPRTSAPLEHCILTADGTTQPRSDNI
eukprot:scaffold93290_cov20-Prasinocladus_malaysianus.AAC.2